MAHFAEIDENKVVKRVLVVDDSQEHRGQEFLANDLELGGTWKQTSYNGNFRGKFAGIGDTYNETLDKFISPRPFASWAIDSSGEWQAPVPHPQDGSLYDWDETAQNWVSVTSE